MTVQMGHFMFFYPFSYKTHSFNAFTSALEQHGFHFYENDINALDSAYYNEETAVSHKKLSQYFYPFVEDKLFNREVSLNTFNRFSKKFNIDGLLQTHLEQIPFRLFSADVHLCPFGVGFLILRTKIEGPMPFDTAMQFAHNLRELESEVKPQFKHRLTSNDQPFATVQDWIHTEIAPMLESFYIDYSYLGANASKMPFFEDERMYVNHYLVLSEDQPITDDILFRAGQLNGYDQNGKPYSDSTNQQYVAKYVEEKVYTRCAPTDQLIITMHATAHVTTRQTNERLAAFYGTNFYTVILHYYYKMMLLKLSFEHSELKWEKDLDIVEELIEEITKFSSRYFFVEVSVRTEGKELSKLIRDILRIDTQYNSIKQTLEELYRVQEDQARDRQNDLLFILTIFSTVSGLFGMNLVIDMFQDKFNWLSVGTFTVLEWFAFIITIAGIGIASLLVGHKLSTTIHRFFDKKRRSKKK